MKFLILIELSRQRIRQQNKLLHSFPHYKYYTLSFIDRFHKIIKENICKQKAEGKILFIILNITTDLVLWIDRYIQQKVWNAEISIFIYTSSCVCLSIFILQWILHWIYMGNGVTFSVREQMSIDLRMYRHLPRKIKIGKHFSYDPSYS